MSIPLYKPDISEEDISAVTDVLRAGKLTTGDTVRQFEKEFAEFVGAPYALAVDSLTSGFLLVLDLLCPSRASMPSATYVSMANALKKFNTAITWRDEWVCGRAYPIETDKGTIWDSAHELEKNICQKDKTGYWLFSTHATKLITTGTGGVICVFSEDEYNVLKLLRDSGRVRTARNFNYSVLFPGWNFYQSDIHAALGLSQLRRYDELMQKRDECFATYQKYLVPKKLDTRTKYLYQIFVDDALKLADHLKSKGIQVSRHFTPLHTQSAFATGQKLPTTEYLSEHLLSIPYFPNMEEEDIKKVSEEINTWRK